MTSDVNLKNNIVVGTGHTAITLTPTQVRETLRRLIIELGDYGKAHKLLQEARREVYGK